ncbi:MAG: 50S ribosomal protein L10 [Candidatus Eisenbacteria bacterium]|uniref:Large ribosomal subunit protein uL10 n=1 Tax=Eiseniibacteriota bacterium TaxID=2212470 RepID=A0A937XDG4_UNCEI|nr:50S ribosomal protein L10 [Candidatus Eisenbacteria bacterium]
MQKTDKEEAVKYLEHVFENARGIYLADFQGMTVEVISELRRRCRGAEVHFQVAKNTLLRRAADSTGNGALTPHLHGPTAIAVSTRDEVEPARVLISFQGEFSKPQIKGGYVAGKFYDAEQVKELSRLPSKDVLLGSLLSVLQAPLSQFCSVLQAPVRDLARILDQVAKQKESAA